MCTGGGNKTQEKQTKRRVCGDAPVEFLPQSRRPSGRRRSITRWAGRRVRRGEAGLLRLLAGGQRGRAGLGADVDQALAGLEAGQRLGAGQGGQRAAQAQHGRGVVLPCRQRRGRGHQTLLKRRRPVGREVEMVWWGGSSSRNQSRFCVCVRLAQGRWQQGMLGQTTGWKTIVFPGL